jgi:hypothetical protein
MRIGRQCGLGVSLWVLMLHADILTEAGKFEEAHDVLEEAKTAKDLTLAMRRPSIYSAAVDLRRVRLARLTARTQIASELETVAEPSADELSPERPIWYVESGYAALQEHNPALAAGFLNEAEEHALRVGLKINTYERARLCDIRTRLKS